MKHVQLEQAKRDAGVKQDPRCSLCAGSGLIELPSGDFDFCFQCNDAIINVYQLRKPSS